MSQSNFTTQITLLGRLQRNPSDASAWGEFVHYYSPTVLRWCRRWGAQEADAEDISQMVLLKLTQKMGEFTYDPKRSFRAWLKTITHHAWYDFNKSQKRPGRGSGDLFFLQILGRVESRDDLAREIDEECTKQMLHEAMCRVQLRVAPQTWDAFRLSAIDGLSGVEAGRSLRIPASMVFVHKYRVQKLLEAEIDRLDMLPGRLTPENPRRDARPDRDTPT